MRPIHVARLDKALRRVGGVVFSGGDYERWDLYVRGGMLGSMRLRVAVEEHGGGRQLVRIRSWPRFSRIGAAVALGFAALGGAFAAAAILGAAVLLIIVSTIQDCATAAGVMRIALAEEAEHAGREPAPHAPAPARPEPGIAGNGFAPAVDVHHAHNGGAANGLTELGLQNGNAVPSPLRFTDRGLNVTDREE